MSKLGKKPIRIPTDTKVKIETGKLVLTGPKGSRELSINDKIFTATISNDNNLILELIDKNKTYTYPNPVYDGYVKIRIAVESAESVEVMIYDFAGYFVKKLTLDDVNQGSIHELSWNIDDVESGVYFANVTAKNSSKSETEILKIGVIK